MCEQFQGLRTDCRHVEERSESRHWELQQKNRAIQENVVEIQNKMQNMETRHNQELVIILRRVNHNMRQIGEIFQFLGNPQ